MIERSTTPGILPTEAIAENRFCEVLHSFGKELLERNLWTSLRKVSSPPLRLSPRRSQKANQRARSDLVSEFNSIYIGFFYMQAIQLVQVSVHLWFYM